MTRGTLGLAVVATMAVAACSDSTGANLSGTPGYLISSVHVEPPSATMYVPDTIRLSDRFSFAAFAIGKSGQVLSGLTFAWKSSDESIAIVDSTGVVTPLRTGTVEISASADKVGKARLVILPATQSLSVSPQLDSIFVDEPIVSARDTSMLRASALDVFGQPLSGVAYSWSSASAVVATVTSSGEVRAVGLGTTSVTVSASGTSAVSSIRVVPLVASVTVTAPATQVLALDTLQLAAISRDYSNGLMTRRYSWASSNPSVATVDSTGRVNFLSTGSATFTVRTAHRTSATTVTAQDRVLTSIDAGAGLTCGVANLGRAYCWGLSDFGQIGSQADSACFGPTGRPPCAISPKRLAKPELVFTKISAGGDFACGITADQQLYCWGNDAVGQVGNGSDGSSGAPALVTVKTERFAALTTGRQHACALNLSGRAFCWGSDSRGQLGDRRPHRPTVEFPLDSIPMNSTTPIPVIDSTLQFRAISAGDSHTCGVTMSGAAYCWGDGRKGQLGTGAVEDSSDVPLQVAGPSNFIAIAAGKSHTCAIDASGSVLCWGDNSLGQLGTGATGAVQLAPVAITGAGGFTAISAGDNHTCGIAGGQVRCWGFSDFGQVGDGVGTSHVVATPATVAGLQATAIAAGNLHTCAMTSGGQAVCWGNNAFGALGNEFQAAIRATPQVVARPR